MPTEISLLKRGTHVLRRDGVDVYLVESPSVNLRPFEGKDVQIRGVLERNADPSLLPVLVATSVAALEEASRPLELPSFHLQSTIPRTWVVESDGKRVSLRDGSSTGTLLTIAREGDTAFPASGGVPFQLDGRRAMRIANDQTGEENIFVLTPDGVVSFHWNPGAGKEETSKQGWYTFLNDLRFSSMSGVSTFSGSGSLAPCGGPAGILCPVGEYCAITDRENNIGRCRRVK
jgi:hypothetical protein